MRTESILDLSEVSIGYGRRTIVTSVEMEVERGDFWCLIGPNGAGKSTLLKTMLGLIPPIGGKVRRENSLRVGYVPQRTRLDSIFPLTTLEVVRFGNMGTRSKARHNFKLFSSSDDDAEDAMERLGVSQLAKIPYRDLSSGQQQRVLIARALVRNPEFLILDEPTAGMDIPSEKRLLDFVSSLNSDLGLTVMLVVHQLSLALGRATKIAFINKDLNLFSTGTAEELIDGKKLSDLYGHPIVVVRNESGLPIAVGSDDERRLP